MFKLFRHKITLFFFLFPIFSFGQNNNHSAKLEFDHIVLFVSDSSLEHLLDQHLSKAKLLSTKHGIQGTYGNYYLFYNTFIELLYLDNQQIAQQNEGRFKSAYTQRWNSSESNPFGFGLNLIPFDTTMLPYTFERYSTADSPKDEYYLMAASNRDLKQPMIYISLPWRKYQSINSLKDLEKVEEFKREDLRNYLSHKDQLKKLTEVVLYTSAEGNGCKMLQKTKDVSIEKSDQEFLQLTFDHHTQGKEIVYDKQFKLVIQY